MGALDGLQSHLPAEPAAHEVAGLDVDAAPQGRAALVGGRTTGHVAAYSVPLVGGAFMRGGKFMSNNEVDGIPTQGAVRK